MTIFLKEMFPLIYRTCAIGNDNNTAPYPGLCSTGLQLFFTSLFAGNKFFTLIFWSISKNISHTNVLVQVKMKKKIER